MTTFMVTGAAGLIGAHIVRELLNAGYAVRALVRPGGSRNALVGLAVECRECDVLDFEAVCAACRGCEVVLHTAIYFTYANERAPELHALATRGTENVVRAAAAVGVRRVVVTSSSVVFGYRERADDPAIDETAPIRGGDNEPAYVAAKCAQHLHARALAKELGLEVVLACPTMTIGPSTASLSASNGAIAAYFNDQLRCTYPGGCNIVAAHDVGRGHVLLARDGVAGESYLLGSENLTWRHAHTLVAELAGLPAPRFELNHAMAYLAATAEELIAGVQGRMPLSTRDQAAMIGRYYWYSHVKAARLGYAPTSARAALTQAISWLATSPHVSREVRATLRLSEEVYRLRAERLGSAAGTGAL